MSTRFHPRHPAWAVGLGLLLVALGPAAGTSPIQNQWRRSPHADSMSTPDERMRMNKPGCAHCHTAQGYWREILAKKPSAAPYAKAVGIRCIACHESKQGRNTSTLRVGDVKQACTGCHDILVENDEIAFSSCPQGSMLKGKAGTRFEGVTYKTGTHSKIQKSCAACHMAAQPAGVRRVGGHTFRVISKGEAPQVFNPNGCIGCHKGITLAWVRQKQADVESRINLLKSLLPHRKSDDPEKPEPRPRYPRDPSLTPVQSKAAFNYWEVVKDGTRGVHNPVYIRQLLDASIRALKEEKK